MLRFCNCCVRLVANQKRHCGAPKAFRCGGARRRRSPAGSRLLLQLTNLREGAAGDPESRQTASAAFRMQRPGIMMLGGRDLLQSCRLCTCDVLRRVLVRCAAASTCLLIYVFAEARSLHVGLRKADSHIQLSTNSSRTCLQTNRGAGQKLPVSSNSRFPRTMEHSIHFPLCPMRRSLHSGPGECQRLLGIRPLQRTRRRDTKKDNHEILNTNG
jgi:hypothetical protein